MKYFLMLTLSAFLIFISCQSEPHQLHPVYGYETKVDDRLYREVIRFNEASNSVYHEIYYLGQYAPVSNYVPYERDGNNISFKVKLSDYESRIYKGEIKSNSIELRHFYDPIDTDTESELMVFTKMEE